MHEVFFLLQERELALKKHQDIGIRMDSELPHLVALEDDLLSTGILLYHLKVVLIRIISTSASLINLFLSSGGNLSVIIARHKSRSVGTTQ